MKIVIVDDDKLVVSSLKIILEANSNQEVEVVAVGYNGKEAVSLYFEHKPDILLMDIQMQEMNGLEAAETILTKDPNALILLLTTFSDDEYIIKALNIGTKGYLLKQDFKSILPALEAVLSGQSVLGGEILSKIPNLLSTKKQFDYGTYGLNEKEWNLIEYVAKGLSNKEISCEIYLSEGTIRNYLSIILDKLQLRDRTQLAVFYYEHCS